MNIRYLLLALASVSFSAMAQAPLGTVTDVQGVVTATQGASGVTVAPGTAVQNGMRFVTTSRGTVTLRLNSGCTVTVPANHSVTVLQSMTCQQLTAAVQPVPAVATQAPLPAGVGAANGVLAAAGIGLAATVLQDATKDDTNLSGR
ncbi:hypothetical protein H8N03_02035 [Ramlibacter sp. USB13]|uniref:Uncharacterized protein n=1 Tax=Ramlibacter cellulosilyticus TaxID=2764187 RepID=A0A923S9I7_9BURK|nr:hypothetical protein [Ramlibacter cellulosilyticus]MBC5781705.1 hypothetical protein [Ramlibacter cellulosilyticus]